MVSALVNLLQYDDTHDFNFNLRRYTTADPDAATNKYVGFGRKEMGSEALTATVKHFDCHSFLVHNTADTWPSLEFGGGDAATAVDDALKAAASGAFKAVAYTRPLFSST
jgi:hypothetical protein